MSQQVEYKVLTARPDGMRLRWSWYHGEEKIGPWGSLEEILNDHARSGWEVHTYAICDTGGQLILQRQAQGGELSPTEAPEGRGDEASPVR